MENAMNIIEIHSAEQEIDLFVSHVTGAHTPVLEK